MSGPLFVACETKQSVELVSTLIAHRADVNQVTKARLSPLYITCENSQASIVKTLLTHSANPLLPTAQGASAIYAAVQNNDPTILSLLLTHLSNNPISPKSPDNPVDMGVEGFTPLYMASEDGAEKVLELLLAFKANPLLPGPLGVSSLYIACMQGHKGCVSRLLEAKADPLQITDSGETALQVANEQKHTEIVDLLTKSLIEHAPTVVEVAPGTHLERVGSESTAETGPVVSYVP